MIFATKPGQPESAGRSVMVSGQLECVRSTGRLQRPWLARCSTFPV